MKEEVFKYGTRGGWRKSPSNPFLRYADHGTCFDPSVIVDEAPFPKYRLYFSWRPQNAIALIESEDAVNWSRPRIVLGGYPRKDRLEDGINRQVVLKKDGLYHMWYSGQGPDRSVKHAWIFHATSGDGYEWRREGSPALGGDASWEALGVMCPHVIWDDARKLFRMWYSGMSDGGRMYEPDSIGYAESSDGLKWVKPAANPVFAASGVPGSCDSLKVTACQVLKRGAWHYMFYIGFQTHERATICLARSRDGISGWERHPQNPIIAPDENAWDADACYKPSALFDGSRWLLWYNGRNKAPEQLGLAVKDGEDLGFPSD